MHDEGAHGGAGQEGDVLPREEGRTSSGQQIDSRAEEGNREESRRGAVGQVYFIETEDGQYVKRGFSRQVIVRMSQLGTLRPGAFSLRLLGSANGCGRTFGRGSAAEVQSTIEELRAKAK